MNPLSNFLKKRKWEKFKRLHAKRMISLGFSPKVFRIEEEWRYFIDHGYTYCIGGESLFFRPFDEYTEYQILLINFQRIYDDGFYTGRENGFHGWLCEEYGDRPEQVEFYRRAYIDLFETNPPHSLTSSKHISEQA